MEHVVFFPAHDGSPAFRRVSSLEDAVRLVEHLRNVENVNEVSVHALTEVPLAFKTWYRVEVPAGDATPVSEATSADGSSVEVPSLEVPSLEVPEQPMVAAGNGRTAEPAGPSSLGFFSS